MGIRVHCPNGHKLNVKAYLAGKTGVCPHCGSKFAIPFETEGGADATASIIIRSEGRGGAPAESQAALEAAQALSTQASSNHAPPAAGPDVGEIRISTSGPAPREKPSAPINPASREAAQPVPLAAVVVGPTPALQPAAPAAIPFAAPAQPVPLPAAQPVISDPIAEAPQALWYVQPAGGEKYGPAPGATLREWIAQGRVGPDSLVWREGWPEWRPASSVFTQLKDAAPPAAGPVIAPVGPTAAPVGADGAFLGIRVASAPPSVAQAYAGARRKSNLSLMAMIVFLLLLVIVLATVFVLVLRKPEKENEKQRDNVEQIDAAAPRTSGPVYV